MKGSATGSPRSALMAGALAGALAAVPAPLAAQQAGRDSVPRIPIDTLTVTVVRAPLELRLVPFAVTSIDAAAGQRAAPGLALDEVLRAVPGVQVDNRYNFAQGERIAIRGFGARSQFGVRGIKIVVDGIPATLPDGQTTLNLELGSIARAEVIRGPSSALWGNAAGGVIQLESALPPAVPLHQEVRVVAGDHGLLRAESRTGGRAGRAFYQASVARLDFGGFREHADARHLFGTAQLGFRGARDDVRVVFNAVDYAANDPGSLSAAQLLEDRSQAHAFNRTQKTSKEGRQAQLGAAWRRGVAGGALEISAYGVARDLYNAIAPRIIDLDRVAGGARALLRGRGSIGGQPLRWVAGAEAEILRDDRTNHLNEQGTRGALALDQEERVSGLGTFVELSAPIGERLALLGGARYDAFRFSAADRLVSPANPDDSGERRMDALSPFVGAVYTLDEAIGVYANLGTAFQTPTTTELANRPSGAGGFNPELEPQHTRALEAGLRGRLGSVLAYALAGYRATVDNELIGFEVPASPGRTYFRNAGSTVHRGVEAEVSFAPTAGLFGRVVYTYSDARFERYRTASRSYDGNRVPGIAPHRLEATLRYHPAAWFVELQTRYLARMPVDDAGSAHSPAYALTDLRAGLDALRLGGARLSPFLGINNLFDRQYNTSVVVNAAGGRFFEPGPARSLYAGAGVAFGGR